MPKLSKKKKEEWSLFIHPVTGKRTYNELCRRCVRSRKQSYQVIVIECPRYQSKRTAEDFKNKESKRMKIRTQSPT